MRNPDFVTQSIRPSAGGDAEVGVAEGYVLVDLSEEDESRAIVTMSANEARAFAYLLKRAADNLEPTGRGEIIPSF